jgi:hypothetical protein
VRRKNNNLARKTHLTAVIAGLISGVY